MKAVKKKKKITMTKTFQIFDRQIFLIDEPFVADPLDMNFRNRNTIRERWGKTRETLL